MKTWLWSCCLVLLAISCKTSQEEIDPKKAELLQDADFKQYIAANIATISMLSSMGKDPEFRNLSKEEKKRAFSNLVTDNDFRDASDKSQLYLYQKIHRKYIAKNKFTSVEMRAIVREQVSKEIYSNRLKEKEAKQ